jgi:hypothetical protein
MEIEECWFNYYNTITIGSSSYKTILQYHDSNEILVQIL